MAMALFVPVGTASSSWHQPLRTSRPPTDSHGTGCGRVGLSASLGVAAAVRWRSFKNTATRKLRKLSLRAEELDLDLPTLDLDPKALDSAPELSFMIEELPSRNSSSLIVQHRLGSETQIPAVLKLVAAWLEDVYGNIDSIIIS